MLLLVSIASLHPRISPDELAFYSRLLVMLQEAGIKVCFLRHLI
jgi:hypothetical protein